MTMGPQIFVFFWVGDVVDWTVIGTQPVIIFTTDVASQSGFEQLQVIDLNVSSHPKSSVHQF